MNKEFKITRINGKPTESKRFIAIMREIMKMNLQYEVTEKEIKIPLVNFKFEVS